jgi:integrase/recombinase XerD
MQNFDDSKPGTKRLRADLALIDEAFVEYLRERHTAARTITIYRGVLAKLARSFSRQGRSLSTLRREEVSVAIRHRWRSQRNPQAALHAWLKFLGRFQLPAPCTRWRSWVDDYARFMEIDRGLAPGTCYHYLLIANRYLGWQFRRGAVDWGRVHPQDIWRYAARLQSQGRKPGGVSEELSVLRQFLRFVHLRGSCPPALAQAVPAVADRGRSVRREFVTEEQRRKFLASFDRKSAEGRRDYTMALCMIDLGLRAIEVVRLRHGDIDWEHKALAVPPAKTSRGRQLPLPAHVATALRIYVRARPTTISDRLFVGQARLMGRPLSSGAVQAAVDRAYRRCGFRCYGTHRLRRSFATRLYARGANMKEIADLLGHRRVMTTERYAQVDLHGLRALVQPWPA